MICRPSRPSTMIRRFSAVQPLLITPTSSARPRSFLPRHLREDLRCRITLVPVVYLYLVEQPWVQWLQTVLHWSVFASTPRQTVNRWRQLQREPLRDALWTMFPCFQTSSAKTRSRIPTTIHCRFSSKSVFRTD